MPVEKVEEVADEKFEYNEETAEKHFKVMNKLCRVDPSTLFYESKL